MGEAHLGLSVVVTLMLLGILALSGCAQAKVARPAPTAMSGLPGTVWHVDKINGVLASSYVDAQESFVAFAEKGRLAAQDPCGNAVEGEYRINRDEIQFSNVISSLIGCPPELAIDVALYYTRSGRIEGPKLFLTDAAGVVVVEATFTSAKPTPSPTPQPTPWEPHTPRQETPPASPTPPG